MQNKHGLTPTPITDKNGKQTTVYVKAAHSSATPTALPVPTVKNQRAEALDDLSRIFQRIDTANADRFSAIKLSKRIHRASDNDIDILAATLDAYPEFEDVLASAALHDTQWNDMVSMAVVYDPDLPAGNTASRHRSMFLNALDNAHAYMNGDLLDGGWGLGNESDLNKIRAQRFVAAWITVESGQGVASYELLMRMLDSNRTDHDETLKVLRSNPDATVAQIDFILSGGSKSLSSGAI
jgi:hypothetical protein